MNILLISNFFPPHKGGVETATYYTAKNLTERGHKVIVLTSKSGIEKYEIKEDIPFQVLRYKAFSLPEIRGLTQSSSLGIIPKAIFDLPKIIKKYNIQIIHLEGRFFPISWISAFLNLIIFKRPMFLTVQGRLEIGITNYIENLFDQIITKLLYRNIRKIICVSKSLEERLIRYGINEKRLFVIPNGVDISFFSPKKQSDFLNNCLKKEKKNFKKVLFVGRLDPQKGVKYLVKAIPKVIEKYDKVHFFILGNGNMEKELKNLSKSLDIEEFITFIDMIPLKKMPEVYSSADIFCLPSIHEGFPLSLAEALSMGLIIVASKTEGIPDAIEEHKNGFLVQKRNVNQLSFKLLKSLNLEEGLAKEIKHNNRDLAKKKFSWKIITKKIETLYLNDIKN